jgi:hypothetical protein
MIKPSRARHRASAGSRLGLAISQAQPGPASPGLDRSTCKLVEINHFDHCCDCGSLHLDFNIILGLIVFLPGAGFLNGSISK